MDATSPSTFPLALAYLSKASSPLARAKSSGAGGHRKY